MLKIWALLLTASWVVSNRTADPRKPAAGGLAVALKESLQQTGGFWYEPHSATLAPTMVRVRDSVTGVKFFELADYYVADSERRRALGSAGAIRPARCAQSACIGSAHGNGCRHGR